MLCDSRGIASARAGERVGAADQLLARRRSVPGVHMIERPIRVLVLVTHVAGVRNGVVQGISGTGIVMA